MSGRDPTALNKSALDILRDPMHRSAPDGIGLKTLLEHEVLSPLVNGTSLGGFFCSIS
jgi:hypothetical protein